MIDAGGMQALLRLVRLGHDTVRACDLAIDATSDQAVTAQLRVVRDEQRRGADAIARVIEHYGEPSPAPAGVGARTPGRNAERAVHEVLSTVRTAEAAVRGALRGYLEPDLRDLLKRHLVQHERHRRYLEEALDWRTWETRPTP